MILVICSHVWWHPRGAGLGVDVFFVLSGFLITALLIEEHDTTGAISLRRFYARRALRILPASYVFLLAMTCAVATGFIHTSTLAWVKGMWLAIAYLANISIAFGTLGTLPADLRHMWSLSAEEQFYLVWPLLLFLLLAARVAILRIALLLLLLSLLSVGAQMQVWFAEYAQDRQRIWYGPDTHLEPIVVGCLAALVYERGIVPDRLLAKTSIWLPALIIAVLAIGVPPLDHTYLYDGPFSVFPFACAVVLLGTVTNTVPALASLFSATALRKTGRVSYGLYLWHFPFVEHFGLIGVAPAAAVTVLSYRFVELPCLRRKPRATESVTDGATLPAPAGA